MVRTYYERLGVPEDATTDEIETAYRKRLKETHPDVSDDDDAGERTRRLVEARDVLVDDEERARYDRLGHDAYVGDIRSGDGDTGPVADAARRAGYDESSEDSETTEPNRGGRDPWQRARDRATRERRARERVSADRGTGPATGSTATESTGGDSHDGARGRPGSDGYTVRRQAETGGRYREWLPDGRALSLLVITFALYPVLLFCALLPAFPLLVNLTVALCAVLVVAYLQTYPAVAVVVFGGWTGIATAGMILLAVDPLTLLALSVLCGTWLPFGFSLLTFWVLRW